MWETGSPIKFNRSGCKTTINRPKDAVVNSELIIWAGLVSLSKIRTSSL